MSEMHEAQYYEKLPDHKVACHLCPQECKIAPGRAGFCGFRRNINGVLRAELYGKVAAVQMDPIEKKPLYHFHPGADILSVGTNGCNFRCQWCQNWHLSDGRASLQNTSSEEIVATAKQHRSMGIAYTYNEPLVWYEFVLDCAQAARDQGMVNVLVTNGFINPEPLVKLLPLVDAMNIDLKAIQPEVYKRHCKGQLEPVQHTIRKAANACHVELTNLIVTGVNDSREDIEALVDFVASVDKTIPLHFSRYFPNFNFDAPPTPETTIRMAYEIGAAKLDYVYVGNINLAGASDTACPSCGNTLVTRTGYRTRVVDVRDGRCGKCGFQPNFVW